MFIKLKETHDPHPWKWWHLPLLVILIAGTIYVVFSNNSKDSDPDWQTDEGTIFGTVFHIKYHSSSDLSDSIRYTLRSVDNSLSTFNEESVISKINSNKSDKLDAMTEKVFMTSIAINSKTNGAFDITVAPLVNAWGFGFENSESIDSLMIDSILQFVGINKIKISNGKIFKSDERVMLDCSAIAKGFGVDMVAEMLNRNNIKDYMVEIGGEVRTCGKNDIGKSWRIGINEPIDDATSTNTELQNVIEVNDISMATSGNYRNFYIKDNKKYAHTIDPKTGYPVQHTILSSTVLASDCMIADAYATSFMVMGLEKAQNILKTDTTIKAYFIYSKHDGTNGVWHSPGLILDKEY